MLMYC
jgi:hypothetical protein